MSFYYLNVVFQCPLTSSFHRIASSHCPSRARIFQRMLCHICCPHNMSCVPWASESLFERYERAWQKWSLLQWLQPLLFYSLPNVFTTWSQSLQSQSAQIKHQASSFQFLTCLVPAVDTVLVWWCIYLTRIWLYGRFRILEDSEALEHFAKWNYEKFSIGLDIYLWLPLRG